MKNFIVTLQFCTITVFCAYGTIRTVSNDPANPAQFTTIQAAVNASVAGDTIYVNASPNNYNEAVTIPRRLVLIGGGYKSANQLNYDTEVNTFNLNSSGSPNASGTVITGFRIITAISVIGTVNPVSNVSVFRNRIGGMTLQASSNWTVYNNIIGNISILNTLGNLAIQNNIINGGQISGNPGVSTVVFDHNVFLRNSLNFLSGVRFVNFTNNIFVHASAGTVIDVSSNSNNFNNNLSLLTTVSATAPTNSFAGGPNTESGNFVGVNPSFVNVPSFAAYDENANYRLSTASPVRNAGTDGTDLGIYGGTYPFPSGGAPGSGFDTSALPPVPQVTGVNIQNGTLAPGAQLRVQIQATTNN